MPKFTPVDHNPFEQKEQAPSRNVKLTPVDHDPFAEQKPERTLLGEFASGIAEGALGLGTIVGGATKILGDVTGSDTLRQWGDDAVGYWSEAARPYAGDVSSYEDINITDEGGLERAGKYALHGLGTVVPTMALTMGAGGIGASIAKKGVTSAIEKGIVTEAMKDAALKQAMTRGALAGAGSASYGLEAGSIGADQSVQGISDPLKALTYAAPAAALDVIPEMRILSKIPAFKVLQESPIFRSMEGRNFLVRGAKEALVQGGMEGATEFAQTMLEQLGANRNPLDPENLRESFNALLIGGISGGVMGGAGGMVSSPLSREQTTQQDETLPSQPITEPQQDSALGVDWTNRRITPAQGGNIAPSFGLPATDGSGTVNLSEQSFENQRVAEGPFGRLQYTQPGQQAAPTGYEYLTGEGQRNPNLPDFTEEPASALGNIIVRRRTLDTFAQLAANAAKVDLLNETATPHGVPPTIGMANPLDERMSQGFTKSAEINQIPATDRPSAVNPYTPDFTMQSYEGEVIPPSATPSSPQQQGAIPYVGRRQITTTQGVMRPYEGELIHPTAPTNLLNPEAPVMDAEWRTALGLPEKVRTNAEAQSQGAVENRSLGQAQSERINLEQAQGRPEALPQVQDVDGQGGRTLPSMRASDVEVGVQENGAFTDNEQTASPNPWQDAMDRMDAVAPTIKQGKKEATNPHTVTLDLRNREGRPIGIFTAPYDGTTEHAAYVASGMRTWAIESIGDEASMRESMVVATGKDGKPTLRMTQGEGQLNVEEIPTKQSQQAANRAKLAEKAKGKKKQEGIDESVAKRGIADDGNRQRDESKGDKKTSSQRVADNVPHESDSLSRNESVHEKLPRLPSFSLTDKSVTEHTTDNPNISVLERDGFYAVYDNKTKSILAVARMDNGKPEYVEQSVQGLQKRGEERLWYDQWILEAAKNSVRIYASKSEGATSGIEKGTISRVITKLAAKLPIGKVEVAQSESNLPEHLQDAIKSQNAQGRVEGIYDPETGKVYLVADNLQSADRAQEVLKHELVHGGIASVLGKKLNLNLQQIFNQYKDAIAKIAKSYGFDLTNSQQRMKATEEFVARHGEKYQQMPVFQRMFAAMRRLLREMGFTVQWSEKDLLALAGRAIGKQEKGGRNSDPMMMVAAWHGSPHDHDKFTTQKIGSGEGAQAYGWGLYFAGSRDVADWYKEKLTKLPDYDQVYNNEVVTAWRVFEEQHPKLAWKFQEAIEEFAQRSLSERDFAAELQNVHFYSAQKQQQRIEDQEIVDAVLDKSVKVDYDPSGYNSASKKGKLYKVELSPNEEDFLDWDKIIRDDQRKAILQTANLMETNNPIRIKIVKAIREPDYEVKPYDSKWGKWGVFEDGNVIGTYDKKEDALASMERSRNEGIPFGKRVYKAIDYAFGSDKLASEFLHKAGIPGIRYLDGTSRSQGEGNHNYVIFDDSLIKIDAKYSLRDAYDTEILVNPTRGELVSMLRDSRYKELRVVKDPDTGDLYVADAGKTYHKFIAEKAGIPWDKIAGEGPEYMFIVTQNTLGRAMNGGAKFSLAETADDYRQQAMDWVTKLPEADLKGFIQNVANLPQWGYQARTYAERSLPKQVLDVLGKIFRTPFFQAESNPEFKPFVYEAAKREQDRNSTMDVFRSAAYNEDEIIAEDFSTLRKDFVQMKKEHGKKPQDDFDKLMVVGDALKKEFATIDEAKEYLPNVSPKAFELYQRTRKFTNLLWPRLKEQFLENSLEKYADAPEIQQKIRDIIGGEKVFTEDEIASELFNAFSDVQGMKLIMPEYQNKSWWKDLVGMVNDKKAREDWKSIVKDENIDKELRAAFRKVMENKIVERQVKYAAAQLLEERKTLKDLRKEVGRIQGWIPRVRDDGAYRVVVNEIGQDEEGNETRTERFMQMVDSVNARDKLQRDVEANMKKYMPINYKADAEYEVSWEDSKTIPEGMYGSRGTDMATEAILEKALDRAIQEGNDPEAINELRDALRKEVANAILARGAGRHQIKRSENLVEGYKAENVMQLLDDYIGGTAGALSKARYAMRQFNNLAKAPASIKGTAFEYINDSFRNQGYMDKVSGTVRNVVSLWFMGFKPAAIIINGTQNYTFGQAELSRYTKNPLRKMLAAQKAVLADYFARRKGERSTALTDEERTVIDKAIRQGIALENANTEATGVNEGVMGKKSQILHKTTELAMRPFQFVEQVLNRETAFVAAYRVFRNEQKMSEEAAYDKAVDFVYTTHFMMNKGNLPKWARNPIGRTAYALQSYTFNALNYIWNRGTSSDKAQLVALARTVAAFAVLGGLGAIPFGDDINKLLRRITGKDYRLEFEAFTKKEAKNFGTPGELVNDFIWRGLPSIAQVDLSGALAMRTPFLSGIIAGDDAVQSVSGPVGGMAVKASRAMKSASRGDWSRAAEVAAPEAVAGVMRGVRQATEGATTLSGKPIYGADGNPMKMTYGEAFIRSLGFQPIKQAEAYKVQESEQALGKWWNDERQAQIDRYRLASPSERIKMRKEINSGFNTSLKGSQVEGLVKPIKPETLTNALKFKPNKGKMKFEGKYLED